MTDIFDKTLGGKRIRLIHTDDKYTKLKEGDEGTIKFMFLNLDEQVIQVDWDSGSNLGLIVGKDSYEILSDEEAEHIKNCKTCQDVRGEL